MTAQPPPADAVGGTRIGFLSTNIGRGHPHYLDGILECLPPHAVGAVRDVLDMTSGPGRAAWRMVRAAYQLAGRSRMFARCYSHLRSHTDYGRAVLPRRVLGAELRRRYLDDPAPLIVAHPLLAAILNDKANLIYQHGEVAAPGESAVPGRHLTIVPLPHTAAALRARGVRSDRLFVSGLCIEPALVDRSERAFIGRIERASGSGPLCGAFFSSGAEPRVHVERLVAAALSAVDLGGTVLAFAREAGYFATRFIEECARARLGLEVWADARGAPVGDARAVLCLYGDREGLNRLTVARFEQFDYFVAPSHERTNWALGLGLPMFVVDPAIGSFAPLNRAFVLECGAGTVLDSRAAAAQFGETVRRLRASGQLRSMSEAGWQRFDTRGFSNIAQLLLGWS